MAGLEPRAVRGAAYRIDHVTQRHRDLGQMIDAELQRPQPNALVLQRLKRKRLLAKDELEAWQRLVAAIRIPDRAAPHV